jgi:hypothetical protein
VNNFTVNLTKSFTNTFGLAPLQPMAIPNIVYTAQGTTATTQTLVLSSEKINAKMLIQQGTTDLAKLMPSAQTTDSDGDGVPDNVDQCPNTPQGTKVASNGCPMEVGIRLAGTGTPIKITKAQEYAQIETSTQGLGGAFPGYCLVFFGEYPTQTYTDENYQVTIPKRMNLGLQPQPPNSPNYSPSVDGTVVPFDIKLASGNGNCWYDPSVNVLRCWLLPSNEPNGSERFTLSLKGIPYSSTLYFGAYASHANDCRTSLGPDMDPNNNQVTLETDKDTTEVFINFPCPTCPSNVTCPSGIPWDVEQNCCTNNGVCMIN